MLQLPRWNGYFDGRFGGTWVVALGGRRFSDRFARVPGSGFIVPLGVCRSAPGRVFSFMAPVLGQVAPQVGGGLHALEQQVDSTFSLGECQPSDGTEMPRKSTGAPSTSWRSAAGPEPPSRVKRTFCRRPGPWPVRRTAARGGPAGSGTGGWPPRTRSRTGCRRDAGSRPVADDLLDVVGVLAGDQPEGELHLAEAGTMVLLPGALVAAADAVDLGGGAGPDALQGGVSGLTVGGRTTSRCAATAPRRREVRRRARAPGR